MALPSAVVGPVACRAICDRNVNDIIKRCVVTVRRCERPSDLEVLGHSLRVGTAQDVLIKRLRPRNHYARRRLVRSEHRLEVLAVFEA
jgi:hypothetical protein